VLDGQVNVAEIEAARNGDNTAAMENALGNSAEKWSVVFA
jgi:hypothetical protein